MREQPGGYPLRNNNFTFPISFFQFVEPTFVIPLYKIPRFSIHIKLGTEEEELLVVLQSLCNTLDLALNISRILSEQADCILDFFVL